MKKIYTKTGDKGETGLVSGKRISKADERIELYGELDELNSRIGFAASFLGSDTHFNRTHDFLGHVQSIIFDLGSNLACEVENRAKYKLPQIPLSFISEVESEIDFMDKDLPELKNFILPAGSTGSAAFHLCRTNARAVERKLIAYKKNKGEELPDHSIEFLNRISDYFFILARYVNKHQKGTEKLWIPRS